MPTQAENSIEKETSAMDVPLPEKARLLQQLKEARFNVPPFIYVPASDFENGGLEALEAFLREECEDFKVIVRSAHPREEFFKGGTFDSLETYADLRGIEYARNRIIKFAKTRKKLSILRQQKFNEAPELDLGQMGVIVMPFIEGANVMAKMLGNQWEFGYCRERTHKVQDEPYITKTPHDIRLLDISRDIQERLGFRCEIEYILSDEGDICVVQAKDISRVEYLEFKQAENSIRLDGIRRIRKRRNYRERPIYVMDNNRFYIEVISKCEEILEDGSASHVDEVMEIIQSYEKELEEFALKHERFAVLGLSIQSKDLYQIANHYLDDVPEIQKGISRALHANLYQIDYFLAETDTLMARDKVRINICSHDAYGVDTLRAPLWSMYWDSHRHDRVVRELRSLGFKTGDLVGIDVDVEQKPVVYRI